MKLILGPNTYPCIIAPYVSPCVFITIWIGHRNDVDINVVENCFDSGVFIVVLDILSTK